jgi:hypothetical protein
LDTFVETYSLRKRLQKFGEKGQEAVLGELRQKCREGCKCTTIEAKEDTDVIFFVTFLTHELV